MASRQNWAVSMEIRNPPEVLEKEFRRASKDSIVSVARYHWRERIPLRFEQPSALSALATELGFTPRKAKYEKIKARKLGHRKPLVWTGTLRDTVTGQFREPRASRAKTGEIKTILRLAAPHHVRFRGPKGTGPHMKAELSNISQDEANTYARMMSDHIQRSVDRMRQRKTVK